jgi:hypothetical protein
VGEGLHRAEVYCPAGVVVSVVDRAGEREVYTLSVAQEVFRNIAGRWGSSLRFVLGRMIRLLRDLCHFRRTMVTCADCLPTMPSCNIWSEHVSCDYAYHFILKFTYG